MDWMAWVIPAIAVGVWIMSNLARGNEAKNAPGQRPRPNNANPPRGRTAEIDRFLEEINERRRQQGQRPATPPPPPPKPRPVQPPPLARPKPKPPSRPRPSETIPTALPIAILEEIPTALAVSSADRPLTAPMSQLETRPMATVPRPAVRRGPAPALMDLLRSREGFRAAFLVSEILGQPRAKRPYRR